MELFLIKLTTKRKKKHGEENDRKERKIENCNKQNHLPRVVIS